MSNREERVQVDVVFRSASGKSILNKKPGEDHCLEKEFGATEETKQKALGALRELGFETIAATSLGASVAASPELVRRVFGEYDLSVPPTLDSWIEAVRIPSRGWYLGDEDRG